MLKAVNELLRDTLLVVSIPNRYAKSAHQHGLGRRRNQFQSLIGMLKAHCPEVSGSGSISVSIPNRYAKSVCIFSTPFYDV